MPRMSFLLTANVCATYAMSKSRNPFLLITIAIIVLAVHFFDSTEEPFLRTSFLDVGQGDATFITFPDQRQMLIDCSRDARILEALGREMKFFDMTIDYLVLTHADHDHIGGCLDVLQKFSVTHVISSGWFKQSEYQALLQESIESEYADHIIVTHPLSFKVGQSNVDVLYPTRPVQEDGTSYNDASLVMKVTDYGQSVLLTGDAEEVVEWFLTETHGANLASEVLKVGHHGSQTSSRDDFLAAVQPRHAVISAGKDNAYNHPSARVLHRLERAGAKIWRTDMQGDILVTLTSTSVYVETR
jgi:competence protein ComEC